MRNLINHKNMVEIVENTKIKAKDTLDRVNKQYNLKNRLINCITRLEDSKIMENLERKIVGKLLLARERSERTKDLSDIERYY